LKNIAKLI